jgi:uncharacterized protein YgiM (DUF1202 family)
MAALAASQLFSFTPSETLPTIHPSNHSPLVPMKRLLATVLTGASLAVALCLSLPQNALARPSSGWVSTTIEGGSANLRSSPSTRSNILATLRNGSSFSIVNERFDTAGYRWYQARPSTTNLSSSVWIRSDLVSFTPAFSAQPRLSCDTAIAETENSIKAVVNTRIISRNQQPNGYTDGPTANRPNSVNFILAGSGGENILASPVFMNQMATQLIENCPDTASVMFSVGETDNNYLNYGIMAERMVRPFQCKLGPNSDRAYNIKWGEQICL